ncbi:MAG TPA: 50S ribosomal protein L29 [Candidatus Aenigmarchaeota archaeon]|nr:50S ribosomal protein L29 [Candidatus Aenigmarchaeota archaeon]
MKRTAELRNMSNEELKKRLKDLRLELLKLNQFRLRKAVPKEYTGKFKALRREIARILTILREREM